MKKRTGEPWIPGPVYGRALPEFTVNLIVRDVDRSLTFYRDILGATVHYADPDFAAIRLLGLVHAARRPHLRGESLERPTRVGRSSWTRR